MTDRSATKESHSFAVIEGHQLPAVDQRLSSLLARASRGDDVAFAELYDAVAARLYGLVVRVVRDPAQAGEVSREAFLEIWRTASLFEEARGSAIDWMTTIAHRRAVDRVRSARAKHEDQGHHVADVGVALDAAAAVAGASVEARRARTALGSLGIVERRALELAYFDGHTYSEVATLLGLPPGLAKTKIRTGLTKLAGALTAPI
jgi:RNA polymerase sigma-70 factor (ECF subfamily)